MNTKRVFALAACVLIAVVAFAFSPRTIATGHAEVRAASSSATIPYSGRLTDESGEAKPDGAYDFAFSLFDAETGGVPLWSESQVGLALSGGLFVTSLGQANPIPTSLLNHGKRWLAVGVRGPGDTGYTALTPRQPLATGSSSPESALAGSACPHDHFGEYWTGTGVGLDTKSNWIGLVGWATTSSSFYVLPSDIIGVYGVGDNLGVRGDGGSVGVKGASLSGVGVQGTQTSTGNNGELGTGSSGVYGTSTDSSGVYGLSTNYAGVRGVSSSGDGVRGESSGGNKSGVYAYNNANNGYALFARCTGAGCYGVYSDGKAKVQGDLTVTGRALGTMPYPDADSGWQSVAQGSRYDFNHNLGGNTDYYVYLAQQRDPYTKSISNGAYYKEVDNNTVQLYNPPCSSDVCYGSDMRIRIWVYK